MNWIAFFILAYLSIGTQTGLGPFMRWTTSSSAGAEPNFGLLAVVFITLNAQRDAALMGAFLIGALQDLVTQQPFGLFALSYGLSALVIVSFSQVVYRGHPLTHFFCTLLAGCGIALVILIHSRIRQGSNAPVTTLSAALYTAILAPFVVGALHRMRKIFAFKK